MVDLKPKITDAQIEALLAQHFDQAISGLTPIETGQIARTFAFQAGGQAFVIRFNTEALADVFVKERYIFEHYAAPGVPLPSIIAIGQVDNFSYAISTKLPGLPMDEVPPAAYKQLLPVAIETLDAIHQVDIQASNGFGYFDEHGVGALAAWTDHLKQIREEEAEATFFGAWHRLFDKSFLERDFFERVYAQMNDLLATCPEERWLVHGDYGANNLLVEQGTITGVLDWANTMYGDFLYDIAYMDFWAPGMDIQERFAAYYQARQREIPHYRDRLRCYQCYITLNALRFFAKTGHEPSYQWTKERYYAVSNGIVT